MGRSGKCMFMGFWAIILAVLAPSPVEVGAQEASLRYLFERVTLVSPASGEETLDAWVGVEQGRFAVISDREPEGWSDARRIRGEGMFLVPGLIDVHVHTDKLQDLQALLVHGVTTVRLGRGTPTHLAWREAVRSGNVRGPRLLVGSPYIWDRGPDGFGVPTPDTSAVRGHVRRFQQQGYDLIKVVDVYDHALAEALFAEAARVGIPVFGHVADDATVPFDWSWTASLGYRTLEHLDEVAGLALSPETGTDDLDSFVEIARRQGIAFTSILSPVFSRARAYERASRGLPAYTSEQEERAFLVSGGNGRSQLRGRSKDLAKQTPDALREQIPDTAKILSVFARLVAEGVTVVPGTEGGRLAEWAGATLHDELELFVRGGMSPLTALRSATADAAHLLGVEGLDGSIRVGTLADAVLVSRDPRSGLETLRHPEGVMAGGRWYDSHELERMRGLFGLTGAGQRSTHTVDPEHPLLGSGSATHPALSPDGRTVAFMSNSIGVAEGTPINFEIYTAAADGSNPVRLTENHVFDAEISWSPDGDRIAFKSFRDGNDEIYVMRRDGSDQRNVTKAPSAEHSPDWSPDGRLLAFNSDRSGNSEIFLMSIEDGAVTQLTHSEFSENSPQFSPDGNRIAFVSNREGNDDVFVMNRDGTNVRRITTSLDSDWSPRWSPDGNELLFISGSFAEDRFDLYSVPADGSASPLLVLRGVDSGNPSWHPSGRCIYVGRYVSGQSRLFVVGRHGEGVARLGEDAPLACNVVGGQPE